jgi:hypothetical protein
MPARLAGALAMVLLAAVAVLGAFARHAEDEVSAAQQRARSSRIRSRSPACTMAARMVSSADWTLTSRPFRSTLIWAIAGRSTAGSACIVSFSRANSTGSKVIRNS